MLRENVTALFLLYLRPSDAVSRILDRGRLWFAILAALAVSMLLHGILSLQFSHSIIVNAIENWLGFSTLGPLVTIVLVFVPALILLRAAAGFGGVGVLMRSDYLSLLLCSLTAWAAAYLPAAALGSFVPAAPLLLVANLYFAVLAAFAIRTIFGIGLPAAVGMSLLACAASIGGLMLSDLVGGLKYLLFSPFALIYAYWLFASDVRSLGEGLRRRRRFQEQLEISTTNPHDADAQYQLGLIYQQRRQHTQAIARFERAIEIDKEQPDAHYQLGRIAREQGRFDDAIAHLKAAAAFDDKFAASEVWRELGAAYWRASRFEESAAALAKYTQRRAYDPEGLYWYGKTLVGLQKFAEARQMFKECIEAVDTTPKHLRAHVRRWKGLAKKMLGSIPH